VRKEPSRASVQPPGLTGSGKASVRCRQRAGTGASSSCAQSCAQIATAPHASRGAIVS
jgi:hypothetical protein